MSGYCTRGELDDTDCYEHKTDDFQIHVRMMGGAVFNFKPESVGRTQFEDKFGEGHIKRV